MKHKTVLHFYLAMLKSLKSPELKNILPGLAEGLFRTLGAETGMDLIVVFFRYIIRNTCVIKKEDIVKIAHRLHEAGEEFMNTLAQEWLNEGKIEGKNEGLIEGRIENAASFLIVLAQEKFGILPSGLVEEVKKIRSLEMLDDLFRRTLKCDSLETFQDWIGMALRAGSK